MNKFTKSFLTLALLGVAGAVNAQDEEWVEIEGVKGWVHEWRTMDEQTDGAALTMVDPDDAEKDYYVVYCRSREQAKEAGNATRTNNDPLAEDFSNFADWDSQFFITWDKENALQEGDEIRVSFGYKAEKEVTIGTQSHRSPGDYIHWACIGDVKFGTDWASFNQTFTVSDAPRPETYTIAFNLAKGDENKFYFRDIKIEVKKAPEPVGEPTWVSTDIIGWVHEWRTMAEQTDAEALTDDDGAFKVYCRSKEQAGEAGNATLTSGQTLADDYSNFASWDSQFFINFGADNALEVGQKLKLTMMVKADKPASVGTQSHAAPGSYLDWYCVGDVPFTEEYAPFEKEVEVTSSGNSGNKAMKGTYTIAFNLGTGIENTYYFKDVKVEIFRIENAPEPEPIVVPEFPAGYEVLANTFNKWDGVGADAQVTEAANVDWNIYSEDKDPVIGGGAVVIGTSNVDPFIYADLSGYSEIMIVCGKAAEAAAARAAAPSPEGLSFRVQYNRSDERNEANTDYIAAPQVVATADASGYAVAQVPENLPYFHLNAIKVNWGQPDLRVFAVMGKKVATGIQNINAEKANEGIYDLNGRRVSLVNKGIYIINGKKVVF